MDGQASGPFPAVTPHDSKMRTAKESLNAFLSSWQENHSLTFSEVLALVAAYLAMVGNRCVRIEQRKADNGQSTD